MHAALQEARHAAKLGEVPVGAVVVHDGIIISRAHNHCEREQLATAHAEMLAIQQASAVLGTWRLEACTLYVTLEPCPMCMGAALNSRLPTIVYGASEPKAGACGSVVDLTQPPGYNHRIEAIGGVLHDECSAILKAFFLQLRQQRKLEKQQKKTSERS